MRKFKSIIFMVVAIVISSIFYACGGGGSTSSTQTISGVAAAGAPIIGYVYLKDSTGKTLGPNKILSDGSFSFDVSGLKSPFYLKAYGVVSGEYYELYSVTTTAGIANINPLTHLAVASAAGVTDPASVYENLKPITESELNNAVEMIIRKLQSLLQVYNANINPLKDKFNANHSGLDAVLDLLDINLNTVSGDVEIKDRTTGNTLTSGKITALSNFEPISSEAINNLANKKDDLLALKDTFNSLINLINIKGFNLSTSDLNQYYATNYGINDGLDRTQKIDEDLKIFLGIVGKIKGANFSLEFLDNSSDYKINGIIYFTDGSFGFINEDGILVTKENGQWKFKGNGYKSMLDKFYPQSIKWLKADGSSKIESGFSISIADNGNNGLNHAIIKGDGLPSNGVTLSKPTVDSFELYLDNTFQNSGMISDIVNFYVLDDSQISLISDNAIYTVEIYYDNNSLVEKRVKSFPKRPYLRSELSSDHFATLSGVLSHDISSAKIGSTLLFNYLKPIAFLATGMWAELGYWDCQDNMSWTVKGLQANQNTDSITTSQPIWTPKMGVLKIAAGDEFRRKTKIEWIFQSSSLSQCQAL